MAGLDDAGGPSRALQMFKQRLWDRGEAAGERKEGGA